MAEPQQDASVPPGWVVVSGGSAPASTGTWEDRGIAGKVWHPASGATERDRVDNSVLGLPPELAALSVVGIGRALATEGVSATGKAMLAGRAALAQATPIAKYEILKFAFEQAGLPTAVAVPAAMAAAGIRRGPKGAAAAEEVAAPASGVHLDTSVPVRPSQLTREQLAERMAQPNAPRPTAAPVAAPPVVPASPAAPVGEAAAPPPIEAAPPSPPPPERPPGWKSPQQLLNEEAIARRRAEYAARSGAAPAPASPAPDPAAVTLLKASETKEYLRLIQMGMSTREALAAIQQQRALMQQFGLTSPTADEIRFPKGMRGGPRQP